MVRSRVGEAVRDLLDSRTSWLSVIEAFPHEEVYKYYDRQQGHC
jgi:hypothetical protein